MEKINLTNRNNSGFVSLIKKTIFLLMLAGTYSIANAQCDLKLTEKITKFLEGEKQTYLKDFIFEFEALNTSKAYSFLLLKDTHYFLHIGVSDKYDSEIEFTVSTGNTVVKQLTINSLDKISIVEIIPKETVVYDIKARSTKGEKSCGVVVIGVAPPANNPEAKTTTHDKVLSMVDEMPEFIIGEKDASQSFTNWAKSNLKCPEVARKKGITGKVYLSFVVNQVGDVTDINVVRGLDPEVDASLVKELKKCPRWQKPGKNKGKPVSVQFTFPIVVKPN